MATTAKSKAIPIIDLFAGPGGLGEGFTSLTDENNNRIFKIGVSIEMTEHAHQTLTLRSFLRKFNVGEFPDEYYTFLKGEITKEELYELYPEQYAEAKNEAWRATLGKTPETEIDERIQTALNKEKNWVLIGGPPCQAFSNVGRSRVGGIAEDDHRVYLYKEYLRIIAKHHPAVFVMENVKGLLSAELNDEKIFDWMLRDLQDPGSVFPDLRSPEYAIHSLVTADVKKDSDYLIRSEEYGVPQKRHRVILLGIRKDIDAIPGTLSKSHKVTLKSIIGKLPAIRSGVSKTFDHSEKITIDDYKVKTKRYYKKEKDSFENWMMIVENFRQQLAAHFELDTALIPELIYPTTKGGDYIPSNGNTIDAKHPLKSWYFDPKLKAVLQHVSRSHLSQDLKRYFFAGLYTKKHNRYPKLGDYSAFDRSLLPEHENVESGKFIDRFKVQVPDQPSATVTSHISKDGHYFIHYDEFQCRSLTVREAARVQTFPDNYFFCGPRTEQYHQVGNAVPPYLAYQIAQIVLKIMQQFPIS